MSRIQLMIVGAISSWVMIGIASLGGVEFQSPVVFKEWMNVESKIFTIEDNKICARGVSKKTLSEDMEALSKLSEQYTGQHFQGNSENRMLQQAPVHSFLLDRGAPWIAWVSGEKIICIWGDRPTNG